LVLICCVLKVHTLFLQDFLSLCIFTLLQCMDHFV
jgi:hypothetical protein